MIVCSVDAFTVPAPDGPRTLATVLNRATDLTVVIPEEEMVLPPDYHLIVDIVDGRDTCLSHGPREHLRKRQAHG